MTRRILWWAALYVAAFCTVSNAVASSGWHHPLSCDGGGYWDTRVQVEVANPLEYALAGRLVCLTLSEENAGGALFGKPADSLRVLLETGQEVLYGLFDKAGAAKRGGELEAGDWLILPVEAEPNEVCTFFLYAGNEVAWRPVEWLSGLLMNPGFEVKPDKAEFWRTAETDGEHRMSLDTAVVHTGGVAARCDVDEGAEPAWVKYYQSSIPLETGQKYRFSAWVKAENVRGKAGWYVHVNGRKPQLINRTGGDAGTFDWREVVIEFETPEPDATFTCGTLLHGTGTAWFDDAKLEVVGAQEPLEVRVVGAETCKLTRIGQDAAWPEGDDWIARVPLYARNFAEQPVERGAVVFDTREVFNRIAKLRGFDSAPEVRIIAPDAPGTPLPFAGSLGQDLYVEASIPARAEKVLWLYVGAGKAAENYEVSLAAWANMPVNALANGSMEEGEGGMPAGWVGPGEKQYAMPGFEAARVQGGVDGGWCLKLNVPATVEEPDWTGWRQTVAVKPSTCYLLAGFLRGEGLDGYAKIHGHFYRADGSFTASPFFGTGPGVGGVRTDWRLTSATVMTPPDCAKLSVHLTINHHGALWHDAVLLMECVSGVAGRIELKQGAPEGLAAWVVNPLVKVFREDVPPPNAPLIVAAASSRNAYEAFQVALCPGKAMAVKVTASALEGPGGAKLEAPSVYAAGYVPIDFPIGYDNKTLPTYYRLRPTSRGNDGWAGWWPDPLVRLDSGNLALEAGEARAVWFDVHIPADAAPGTYRGMVDLASEGGTLSVPVELEVWRFVQPELKHIPALYDLRQGRGGHIFDGGTDRKESIFRWYRFLARYNVSPGKLAEPPQFTYKDGEVSMDTALFDETMAYLIDELDCPAVYTPHVFYACGWGYLPKEIFGLERFSDAYTKAWSDAYRMFIDHITEKGWRDRFVYYLSDEPHESHPETIEALGRVADMAREIAPDVPVYSSTWRYIEGLADHLTMWGIGPQGSFLEEMIPARREAGDRFWFTTDGQMCTDTPYLGIERLLPWFCLKYDAGGYEFWGVSWWTYDPWEYGWHTYINQSSDGEKWFKVRYPNGDGFLAYPPREGETEPVPSIRLVAAREGVEDYEVFHALSAYAEDGDARAREVLERVRSLVNMPNKGGRYSTDVMPNPDAVWQARMAAGAALDKLMAEEQP